MFEALGLDTTPLVQAREAYKRRQEQKRREQEEKEAEERRAREEQYQRLLDEQKQKFLDGERITGGISVSVHRAAADVALPALCALPPLSPPDVYKRQD